MYDLGVEVKPGQNLVCIPGDDKYIHLSQVSTLFFLCVFVTCKMYDQMLEIHLLFEL